MFGGPTIFGATTDDLEMPGTFSYIMYFTLYKQFLLGHATVLTWRGGKEFGLCACDSSPEDPWLDLPGT